MKRRPRSKDQKTVALLVETSRAYGRGICRGVARFAEQNPDWLILYQERNLKESIPESLRKYKVDGILMRVDQPNVVRKIVSLGIPTVDLLGARVEGDCPAFLPDDHAIAEMATDHLVNNGFVHFAFCGLAGIPFSDDRQRGFVRYLDKFGFRVFNYPSRATHLGEILRAEDRGFLEIESIAKWLETLPKPVAVFACNDVRALQVLQACHLIGCIVPDEVAVLGVDNDEIITELCHPRLTSIEPDTLSTGYKACLCLDRMMARSKPESLLDRTAPVGVIERESTNIIATTDKVLASALREIRDEACDGLTVKKLLDHLQISRTHLEAKFKRTVGRTVHDEITRVRLKRVCQLLYSGEETLATIVRKSGYLDISHLSRLFRKNFGVSPGEYRKRNRVGPGGDSRAVTASNGAKIRSP
jgi:LacI family transcriptional regulator